MDTQSVNTIYAAMEDELLVITGYGNRWEVETRLDGHRPQCLALDHRHPDRLYCGTFGDGLYKSEDGGDSWRLVGRGIIHEAVMAVAVGPSGTVFAGTEPSSLFRSGDGGESWQELTSLTGLPSSEKWSFPPRPHTHHVRWIEPDPLDEDRLYVCIEAGALVRSFDGGESWYDRNPDTPYDTHTLATHPQAPGRLYSAAGDGFSQPGNGYLESHDAGESWQRPDEGLTHNYLWGLAVDPLDPYTILVSAARGPQQAHSVEGAESYIYRRRGNSPWLQCKAGLPEPEGTLAPVLATSATEPGTSTFYALTNHGLYYSADSGESWERLEVDWPERLRSQHPQALAVVR